MADLLLLIRGGAMPKSCMDCMLNFECRGCMVTGESWWSDSHVYLEFDPNEERLHSCPLVEVPAHGRLIDADALIADLQYDSELAGRALARDDFANSRERDRVQFEKDCKDNCVRFVEQSETIIPASKEGGA